MVLTYYADQRAMLQEMVEAEFAGDAGRIVVATVDSAQGGQAGIVVLSTVRTGVENQGVGFAANINRACVAVSRQRLQLHIVGHAGALQEFSPVWRKILKHKSVHKPTDSVTDERNDDADPLQANRLYKTKQCSNWEKGSCSYGSRCIYAHGREELRSAPPKDSSSHLSTFYAHGLQLGDFCPRATNHESSQDNGGFS